MFKSNVRYKRGVVLLIVLGTILLVVFLSNIILNTMSSQSRLTHHQVSRIQAYYAAMAGTNYAMEMLRIGTWRATPVNTCPAPAGCPRNDPAFPATIQQTVWIILTPSGGALPAAAGGGICGAPASGACVSVIAIYTAPAI